jgi:hypothetical protein
MRDYVERKIERKIKNSKILMRLLKNEERPSGSGSLSLSVMCHVSSGGGTYRNVPREAEAVFYNS